MNDAKELRRLAQEATPGPWHFWRGWVAADIDNDGGVIIVERPTPSGGKYQARVDSNFKFIAATNPAAVIGLLDRLEAAEKELVEIRHGAAVANDTIKALQAKIEAMERQEPVATKLKTPQFQYFLVSKEDADKLTALPVGAKLYALPGAQGEEK